MRGGDDKTASGGGGALGCLRFVIGAIIVLPTAFFVLMLWLFPDFMGPPRYSYHHLLAELLNHELSGNRYLIRTANFPREWCQLEGAEDLQQFDPNVCAFVMYPSDRKPFFCPRRAGKTCFEVHLTKALWRREEARRTIAATVVGLCDLLERQQPSRYPAPRLDDPHPNKVLTSHYREVFSCLSGDSEDVAYHLVVIPEALVPNGVPKGFDRKHIADHVELTWTRGPW